MTLLLSNATVAVQRRTYDSGTNALSDPVPVAGLGSVPVYVQEKAQAPQQEGDAAVYQATVLWDERYDIRDGDALLGYNPGGTAQGALLHVQHVASSGSGTPLACRSATTVAARYFPDYCSVLRIVGGADSLAGALANARQVAASVPCFVDPMAMEVYPTPAIPNQPQTRWHVKLPPGTDVQSNDVLALDAGQRLYVVERIESPRSYEVMRQTVCVLSATQGQLGDAYLRPNATISTTRPSSVGGLYGGYDARRVHLVFAQVNPAAPLERLQGGVATLAVGLIDLVDADIRQGDGVKVLSLDGASTLGAEDEFTVGGVVRRPLPFCACEVDLIAPV